MLDKKPLKKFIPVNVAGYSKSGDLFFLQTLLTLKYFLFNIDFDYYKSNYNFQFLNLGNYYFTSLGSKNSNFLHKKVGYISIKNSLANNKYKCLIGYRININSNNFIKTEFNPRLPWHRFFFFKNSFVALKKKTFSYYPNNSTKVISVSDDFSKKKILLAYYLSSLKHYPSIKSSSKIKSFFNLEIILSNIYDMYDLSKYSFLTIHPVYSQLSLSFKRYLVKKKILSGELERYNVISINPKSYVIRTFSKFFNNLSSTYQYPIVYFYNINSNLYPLSPVFNALKNFCFFLFKFTLFCDLFKFRAVYPKDFLLDYTSINIGPWTFPFYSDHLILRSSKAFKKYKRKLRHYFFWDKPAKLPIKSILDFYVPASVDLNLFKNLIFFTYFFFFINITKKNKIKLNYTFLKKLDSIDYNKLNESTLSDAKIVLSDLYEFGSFLDILLFVFTKLEANILKFTMPLELNRLFIKKNYFRGNFFFFKYPFIWRPNILHSSWNKELRHVNITLKLDKDKLLRFFFKKNKNLFFLDLLKISFILNKSHFKPDLFSMSFFDIVVEVLAEPFRRLVFSVVQKEVFLRYYNYNNVKKPLFLSYFIVFYFFKSITLTLKKNSSALLLKLNIFLYKQLRYNNNIKKRIFSDNKINSFKLVDFSLDIEFYWVICLLLKFLLLILRVNSIFSIKDKFNYFKYLLSQSSFIFFYLKNLFVNLFQRIDFFFKDLLYSFLYILFYKNDSKFFFILEPFFYISLIFKKPHTNTSQLDSFDILYSYYYLSVSVNSYLSAFFIPLYSYNTLFLNRLFVVFYKYYVNSTVYPYTKTFIVTFLLANISLFFKNPIVCFYVYLSTWYVNLINSNKEFSYENSLYYYSLIYRDYLCSKKKLEFNFVSHYFTKTINFDYNAFMLSRAFCQAFIFLVVEFTPIALNWFTVNIFDIFYNLRGKFLYIYYLCFLLLTSLCNLLVIIYLSYFNKFLINLTNFIKNFFLFIFVFMLLIFFVFFFSKVVLTIVEFILFFYFSLLISKLFFLIFSYFQVEFLVKRANNQVVRFLITPISYVLYKNNYLDFLITKILCSRFVLYFYVFFSFFFKKIFKYFFNPSIKLFLFLIVSKLIKPSTVKLTSNKKNLTPYKLKLNFITLLLLKLLPTLLHIFNYAPTNFLNTIRMFFITDYIWAHRFLVSTYYGDAGWWLNNNTVLNKSFLYLNSLNSLVRHVLYKKPYFINFNFLKFDVNGFITKCLGSNFFILMEIFLKRFNLPIFNYLGLLRQDNLILKEKLYFWADVLSDYTWTGFISRNSIGSLFDDHLFRIFLNFFKLNANFTINMGFLGKFFLFLKKIILLLIYFFIFVFILFYFIFILSYLYLIFLFNLVKYFLLLLKYPVLLSLLFIIWFQPITFLMFFFN